jgi:hypothetical protein
MSMSTEVRPFRTADIRLAAIAHAAGGSLVELDRSNPARLTFVFESLPADFQLRVIRRAVTINAADIIAALEVVHGLLAESRRGRQ